MQPGKMCAFEEDINIPMFVRGPGIPKNKISDLVTSHTDLVPTIFNIAGINQHCDFDGEAIPLSEQGLIDGEKKRHEHVNIEFWGAAAGEGSYGFNIDPLNPSKFSQSDILIVYSTNKAASN
jgi:N-acetylglucosamine-6-sulfatase